MSNLITGQATPVDSEVVVLSTLHQLHADVPGYGFSDLSQLILELDPDVIAVELTQVDLEMQREQPVKQEYQESLFPILDDASPRLVPLEPAEPRFSDLVQKNRHSIEALSLVDPKRHTLFTEYVTGLYDLLLGVWDSPGAVNAEYTDALFRAKHALQNALYGAEQAEAWNAWNEHFLSVILATLEESAPRRLLVLIGAEHAYWQRDRLARESRLSLPSLDEALGHASDQ